LNQVDIHSNFDGGNIEVIDATDDQQIRLRIRRDAESDFFQWFYFRVSATVGRRIKLRIENAAQASYPRGWEDYRPVVSFDRENWNRGDGHYADGVLQIEIEMQSPVVWVAYFAPYSMQRHEDLIARSVLHQTVGHEVLGSTIDGRPMDMLTIGEPDATTKIWAIARQHPGESMAQWWMDGFIDRLVDRNDSVSRALLSDAVVYVVPNMNPDGSFRGHLRTNAVGANLNREWQSPSLAQSPEVFLVRRKMLEVGVDCCIDVHGDEALPYNFIAGTHGIASWNESREALLEKFKHSLQTLNPDFQTTHGYPRAPANSANYGICSSYVAEQFGCLAVTLEMPFKDTRDTPDAVAGWSPERSAKLGRSFVDALYRVRHELTSAAG